MIIIFKHLHSFIIIKLQLYTSLITGSVTWTVSTLVDCVNNKKGDYITKTKKTKTKQQGKREKQNSGLEVHQVWIRPVFVSAVKYIISTANSYIYDLRNYTTLKGL